MSLPDYEIVKRAQRVADELAMFSKAARAEAKRCSFMPGFRANAKLLRKLTAVCEQTSARLRSLAGDLHEETPDFRDLQSLRRGR